MVSCATWSQGISRNSRAAGLGVVGEAGSPARIQERVEVVVPARAAVQTRVISCLPGGHRRRWQGLNQQQPQFSQDKLNNSHCLGLRVEDSMVGQELLSPTVCHREEKVERNQLIHGATLSILACLV